MSFSATVKLRSMKLPTLKAISETLKCEFPRSGSPLLTLGNYRILVFTSGYWRKNRKVLSIRLYPGRDTPATLKEGATHARRLSTLWGCPIKWEFRAMLFETEPSGKTCRCPFRSGYLRNRKLP